MTYHLRPATADEIAHWDELLLNNPDGGNPFQSSSFAKVKAQSGWQPRFCVYDGASPVAALYLERSVPLLGNLWYAPKGPGIRTRAQLESIVAANKAYALAAQPKLFCFKLEPEVSRDAIVPKQLVKVANIQPNAATVLIDLQPTEQEILASFRQRGRRALRKAEAASVNAQAVEPTEENFRHMYNLYAQTAQRANFYLRPYAYYRNFWHTFTEAHQGQLFFAYWHNQPVAGVFVAYLGGYSVYKDGASAPAARDCSAMHLLHWSIMRWLKNHDVTTYDLHSTPPLDQLDNKNHPFYELGVFKTGFNNHITEYIGTYDQIIRPKAYAGWRKFGERSLRSLELRLNKRPLY